MRRPRLAALAAAALALLPAPALAFTPREGLTLCEPFDPPVEGRPPAEAPGTPVSLSWEEADFLAARSPCPVTGAWVRPRLAALIARSDFYGGLSASALVGARFALPSGIELSATMDVIAWRFVQNASIARTDLGTGQATVGALFGNLGFERHGARFVPALRVLVPTSTLYANARIVGLDPGLVWAAAPSRRVELFGSFGYALWGALSRGGVDLWHGPNFTVGAAATIVPRLKFLVQLDAAGKASRDFQFERIAVSGALRLRLGTGLRLELAGGSVLGGIDRTDVIAGLNVSFSDR